MHRTAPWTPDQPYIRSNPEGTRRLTSMQSPQQIWRALRYNPRKIPFERHAPDKGGGEEEVVIRSYDTATEGDLRSHILSDKPR